jgi:hypothetical protein
MKQSFLPLLLGLAASTSALAAEKTPKIAWWPTMAQARTEASRTGKPIFLVAATPHCNHISGMW